MKESYWAYWLVMLGILVMGVMLLISSTTTGTTHDYYELKETASAAMVDAVDYSYYRLYNDVRMKDENDIDFSLNVSNYANNPVKNTFCSSLLSKTEIWFYIPLALICTCVIIITHI